MSFNLDENALFLKIATLRHTKKASFCTSKFDIFQIIDFHIDFIA